MNRSRAFNRDVSRRKAIRKRRMCRETYDWEYYDNLHQYSKNKIHCSCPDCNAKTKNKGKKRLRLGNYNPSINYKISEKRKLAALEASLKEYEKCQD